MTPAASATATTPAIPTRLRLTLAKFIGSALDARCGITVVAGNRRVPEFGRSAIGLSSCRSPPPAGRRPLSADKVQRFLERKRHNVSPSSHWKGVTPVL